jgi:hypothetical protein
VSSMPPVPESGASAEGSAAGPATPARPPHGERPRHQRVEPHYSPFLPLLLLALAGVSWAGFQCYQLINEKQAMATVFTNQTRPFDDAGKLRNSLDALARETAQLASKGNASAKLIVDQLARRGVTINPNASPSAPPQSAK